ncbi:MAG: hypothetical protein KF747_13795 [Nitrospira sp.]|nr:hypothetical protein [Nitrospira sp.]
MKIDYPRHAASRLHAQLLEQRATFLNTIVASEAEVEEFRRHKSRVEPIPSLADLEALLDVAFFSSLTQEERKSVVFSLLYCDPTLAVESKWPVVRFASDLPFSVEQIRKLSPATDPQAIDIGVYPSNGELAIWGTVYLRRSQPGQRSFPPGLSFVSHQVGVVTVRDGLQDLLTFSHGQLTFTETHATFDSLGLRQLVGKAFHEDRSFPDRYTSAAKIIDMACVALNGGVGATVLVVPKGMTPKALDQAKYGVHESTRETLAAALADSNQIDLVRSVAQLAFIDGALVVDEFGMLLGAGTMIRTEQTPDFAIALIDPAAPSVPHTQIALSSFSGGARHRSALVFCYMNPGALALVVSHDGVMSVLVRPTQEDRVLVFRPFRKGAPLSI